MSANYTQTICHGDGYADMDAFNIKIKVADREVTLTILPKGDNLFKVIYYGGILGAISYNEHHQIWEKVVDEDLIAGDLPLYQKSTEDERVQIRFDEEIILKIGQELRQANVI